ncbi:MAG: MBL fold metallo-hydrolase [Gemmatimonadaceae bacterium]|nr:MBL fold metallo-hydrolase [Gemmatimonadaceae bacterium]
MRRVPVVVALLLAAGPVTAQTNYDTVQVRILPVTTSVFVLQGAGGNVAVSLGDDGVLLVDGMYAPLSGKVLAAIRELSSSPVRTVINTHWHGDHTGGNEHFARDGAVIHASENARRRMSTGQFNEALNAQVPPAPPGALPKETIAEVATFVVNGDSIVATKVAGAHTDGDVIVHFTRSNVIHMGDVFNNTGLPIIDRSSGGSVNGIIEAVDRILATADDATRIVPGHGAIADKARLKRYRDVVVALRDRIRTLISTGRTVEQILELNIGRPYERDFPVGHTRFVRAVHQELTGTRSR